MTTTSGIRTYLKAVRAHQWLKNLLVFVPPLMAHRVLDPSALGNASLAFISFSLCASAGYLVNDILDLAADRLHPVKQSRPLAAGELSPTKGAAGIPLLLVAALTVAVFLPSRYLAVLSLYFLLSVAYSWRLKRAVILDVLVLAGFYTLRIIAGGAATETLVSFWLLAFSMFLFLSLGLLKRYAELMQLVNAGRDRPPRRGYQGVDIETLAQLGSASAFMSVLVLALYINSEAVQALYSNPEVIWLLCPLLLYMLGRVWLLARRGELQEDPLVFLLQDRRSQLLVLVGFLLLWTAA